MHHQGRQKHQVYFNSVRIMDRDADEDNRGILESVDICMLHWDLNRDGSCTSSPMSGTASFRLPLVAEWQVTAVPLALNHTIIKRHENWQKV